MLRERTSCTTSDATREAVADWLGLARREFAPAFPAPAPTARSPVIRDEPPLELEKIALEDDYFIARRLYPNVDFYSGLIYEALGLPVTMFPVMFAIPRTSGWIAQWLEVIDDEEHKIARPRQIYTGERQRDHVPIDRRG